MLTTLLLLTFCALWATNSFEDAGHDHHHCDVQHTPDQEGCPTEPQCHCQHSSVTVLPSTLVAVVPTLVLPQSYLQRDDSLPEAPYREIDYPPQLS